MKTLLGPAWPNETYSVTSDFTIGSENHLAYSRCVFESCLGQLILIGKSEHEPTCFANVCQRNLVVSGVVVRRGLVKNLERHCSLVYAVSPSLLCHLRRNTRRGCLRNHSRGNGSLHEQGNSPLKERANSAPYINY